MSATPIRFGRSYEARVVGDRSRGDHRRADCWHYGTCLDECVACRWDDFSCDGCPDYLASGPAELVDISSRRTEFEPERPRRAPRLPGRE